MEVAQRKIEPQNGCTIEIDIETQNDCKKIDR